MANFTQEQLDALTEAISQGAKKVKYADKEVEYHSIEEMLKLRDLMKRELGQVQGSGRTLVEWSKGL